MCFFDTLYPSFVSSGIIHTHTHATGSTLTALLSQLFALGDTISNTYQRSCPTFSQCFSTASITSAALNSLSLGFMRLSICIFVLRLLPPNSRTTKYAAWFAIMLNFVATVVCLAVFAALNPYSSHKAVPTHELSLTLNRSFMAAATENAWWTQKTGPSSYTTDLYSRMIFFAQSRQVRRVKANAGFVKLGPRNFLCTMMIL